MIRSVNIGLRIESGYLSYKQKEVVFLYTAAVCRQGWRACRKKG